MYMLDKLAYYCLVYPASLLPLRLMYVFTDFFYYLLITIIPYRRKVVMRNIVKSFPEKSKAEHKAIMRKFYRHLTDLLAEGAKNMSISKKELQRRFKVANPEIVQTLFENDKSVLLVSGHYNNWEWLITAQQFLFPHQAVGIGMPLSNGFWDKKINARRARFGINIIHSKTVNDFFKKNNEKIATLVLADQSPGDARKCYWTTFLNQPTGVLYGPELLAHKYDHAVVFFHVEKVKRGHYTMHLKLLTDTPHKTKWGEITEAHTSALEKVINDKPEFWIWSHKRWKRAVPEDLSELKEEQLKKFESHIKR